MSLTDTPVDREVLAAIFASRVALAKKTEDEAVAEVRQEYARAKAWIASQSQKEKSFLWCCDYFDLEPSAVRRAILERKV